MAPLRDPEYAAVGWDSLSAEFAGISGYWISRLREHERALQGGHVKPKQLAQVINDLATTGTSLFEAVVALQRRQEDTQAEYDRWYREYQLEQARLSQLAIDLESEAVRQREKCGVLEEQLQAAREDETRNRWMLEESRRELKAARLECRRAWAEVSRLEEQGRHAQSMSTPRAPQQAPRTPESRAYDTRPLPDPPTSLDPYDASITLDENDAVIEEETSSIGDVESDADLQHRLQVLEMQYWVQQAQTSEDEAGPSDYQLNTPKGKPADDTF